MIYIPIFGKAMKYLAYLEVIFLLTDLPVKIA